MTPRRRNSASSAANLRDGPRRRPGRARDRGERWGTKMDVRPAAAAREAARTGLTPVGRLLRPRSIAIVGISPEPGSFGATMLSSLNSFDYNGEIHLVSRTRGEVF